jgi:adenylosuccinate synthase
LLINTSDTVIFEGAQGVLLDETHGFAPYYTWSPTTAVNACKYQNLVFEPMNILGVLRLYPTRHGAGPFPTFDEKLTSALVDPHNPHNQWQGSLKVGWHDDLLLTYALSVCEANKVGITNLVVTHLDTWPQVNEWKHAVSYRDSSGIELSRKEVHERLSKPDAAKFLAEIQPVYESSTAKSPSDVLHTLNSISWLDVMITSAGPTTGDKKALTELLSVKTLKRRKE